MNNTIKVVILAVISSLCLACGGEDEINDTSCTDNVERFWVDTNRLYSMHIYSDCSYCIYEVDEQHTIINTQVCGMIK